MTPLKSPLLRLASAQPETSMFRSLYANMAREAGIREDQYARASFIEGLMGAHPGSLSKTPRGPLQAIASALEVNAEENPYIDTFRKKYHMSDSDIALLTGVKDLNLFGSLVAGASKGMLSGSARGLTPEDVAMSIASGLSPLTLEPLRYGAGKNVFYHLGTTVTGKVTMAGFAAILKAEARNRAYDITRGTSKGEGKSVSLYTPAGTGEGDAVLQDFLADEVAISNNLDVVQQIFEDKAILRVVDTEVRKQLVTPMQVAVWAAICSEPDILDIEAGELNVDGRALAMQVAKMTGVEYKGRSSNVVVAAVFREKIRPAFRKVLDSPGVAAALLKSTEIRQLIYEETAGHAHMAFSKRLAKKLAADGLFQLLRRDVMARAAAAQKG